MSGVRKNRGSRFPCGVCNSNCTTNCLHCNMCKVWFHSKCENVSDSELDVWSDIELEYVCSNCRSLDGTEFDYLMGMHRLQTAAATKNINILKQAVRREALFKTDLHIPEQRASTLPGVDKCAKELMDNFVDEVSGTPHITTGDGDCLFNAISILLCGEESMSVMLRYHTCKQLILNWEGYMLHPLRPRFQLLACSYEQTCLDAARIGNFSNPWTLLAVSDVLGMNVRVIYPHVNGRKDIAHQTLNTIIKPTVTATDKEVSIIWYRMGSAKPITGQWYAVNHFAAVSDVTQKYPVLPASPISDSDNDNDEVIDVSTDFSPVSTKRRRSSENEWEVPKRKRLSSSSISSVDSELSVINRFETLQDESDTEDFIEGDGDQKEEEEYENSKNTENSLKDDKFLENDELLCAFLRDDSPLERVPLGPKNNTYFKIQSNTEKRKDVPDDCGAWDSSTGTTVNQVFTITEDNQLYNVFRRDGLICSKKIMKKKITYVPIEPQPTDILVIHRYYTKLKDQTNYRKRVTTIKESPKCLAHISNLALVEYLGTKVGVNPAHGNSKSGEGYKRTDPKILQEAHARVGTKKATEVTNDMAMDDSLNAPKSARQLQDKIYREEKKKNNTTTEHSNNVADEILSVLGSLNSNNFVQEVVCSKGKQPLIIIYSDEQIMDLKKNCVGTNSSVVGIDRTFNLGKVFVTAVSYKNRSVITRKNGNYPIMLGPLCLHWDAEQSTYHKFFTHLRDKIGSQNLTFGTDDEKAMRNSLYVNFPESNYLLCTKHLKDNIRQYLQRNGSSEKDRERILSIIFSEEKEGLVFSDNDFEFATREDSLSPYFTKYQNFKTYYDRYLINKLKKHVYIPLRDKIISKLWTNNNAESINNRLKQSTDWKQLKLPSLVDRLSSVSQTQQVDLRRALYGAGNYKLFGKSTCHLLDEHIWHSKSHTDKNKLFLKFLNSNLGCSDTTRYVQSTDGKFKCIAPKHNVGKKPGQRRRQKAERTYVHR